MTNLLYWLVYHFDLGRFGPRVLDLAVHRWLKHEARLHEPSLLQTIFRTHTRKQLNFGE
jgi:hypothetical protein